MAGRTVAVCGMCGGDRLLPLTFEARLTAGTSEGRSHHLGRPHFKCLTCGSRMGRAAHAAPHPQE